MSIIFITYMLRIIHILRIFVTKQFGIWKQRGYLNNERQ